VSTTALALQAIVRLLIDDRTNSSSLRLLILLTKFTIPQFAIEFAQQNVTQGASLGEEPVVQGKPQQTGMGDEGFSHAARITLSSEPDKAGDGIAEEKPE